MNLSAKDPSKTSKMILTGFDFQYSDWTIFEKDFVTSTSLSNSDL